MHANVFRRPPLAGGSLSRAAASADADSERRVNPTSALLVLLALVGIVGTFLFGMWMIDFMQPHA